MLVRVRVRVWEQGPVPVSSQASVLLLPQTPMATHTGWDSVSVQAREAGQGRALGGQRRRGSTFERLEQL